jgi:hypothetical protein
LGYPRLLRYLRNGLSVCYISFAQDQRNQKAWRKYREIARKYDKLGHCPMPVDLGKRRWQVCHQRGYPRSIQILDLTGRSLVFNNEQRAGACPEEEKTDGFGQKFGAGWDVAHLNNSLA